MTGQHPNGTPAGSTHVELAGVSRSFGGVRAVRDVSLRIVRGEVHALVGENGAGKSTLSKMIAGLIAPDGGELIVDGRPVTFNSPRAALHHGIATIAQELALVPGLTVAQNVYLGAEPRTAGFVRRRALARRYQALAAGAGFDLPGSAVTGTLRTADQQKVEILRAVARDASMIIMDEPTAALSHDDTQRLHGIIRSLAASGRTVLLISHFLGEVLALADTVSVLRDGALVRTGPARDETEASLIEAMLGRSLGSVFPTRPPAPAHATPVLEVDGLTAPGVAGVSLRIAPGEIVGLAGLVGAGRTELARAIYGASRPRHGTVRVDGRAVRSRSPRAALRAGVVLIPESRKEQGLLARRSIIDNITLSSLAAVSRAGVIRFRRQRDAAATMADRLTVRAAHLKAAVDSLSGGNQQKVLFGRALLSRPRMLIADEPTRGVDVGSRRAIYDLLADQARAGLGVLVISSDVEEVLGLAHRVLVMRGGRVVAELTGDQMTEQAVLTAAFSEPARSGPARSGPARSGPGTPASAAPGTRHQEPTTEKAEAER